MFEAVVVTLMVGALVVLVGTRWRRRSTFRWWPAFGLLAFVLVQARVLVETPSLPADLQEVPSAETVAYIQDRVAGLVIGSGLSLLGLGCAGVFFAGLARRARDGRQDSLAPGLILLGGGSVLGASLIGWGLPEILAEAASADRAPTTVAAVYTLTDSMAYVAYLGTGLVAVAVALSALREGGFPRGLGWVSLVLAVVFGLLTFLPVLSWFPMLVFLLVAGTWCLRDESRERASNPAGSVVP